MVLASATEYETNPIVRVDDKGGTEEPKEEREPKEDEGARRDKSNQRLVGAAHD